MRNENVHPEVSLTIWQLNTRKACPESAIINSSTKQSLYFQTIYDAYLPHFVIVLAPEHT